MALKSLCYQAGREVIWNVGNEQDTFAQKLFVINAVLSCDFSSFPIIIQYSRDLIILKPSKQRLSVI